MAIVVLPEAKKRGKYKTRNDSQGIANRTIDGIIFDSAKEATRYTELCLLSRANKISHLQLQPGFRLEVNGQHVCTYVADFQYLDLHTMHVVTEDVKGVKTAVYRIKKKLLKALLGIDIQEI